MKKKLILAVTFIIMLASFSTACGKKEAKVPVAEEAAMGKNLMDKARDATGQQQEDEEAADNMVNTPAE